jgi:large subunit ribosomal protein L22
MEIRAQAKFIRTSPRRARLVADLTRGLDVEEAINQLQFMPKVAAGLILKLLNSAVANAVNNFKLKKDNLYIKKITVDGGPVLKRWQPRAFGRATPIRKRSSHILIVLGEKVETAKAEGKPKEILEKPKLAETIKAYTKEQAKEAAAEEKKQAAKGEVVKKEAKRKRGFLKNIFSRRTGSK